MVKRMVSNSAALRRVWHDMLQALRNAHNKIVPAIGRWLKGPTGRTLIITLTAFAIGAFVSKLAFIEDWHSLLSFIVGGILGAAAVTLGILHDKIDI